MSDAERPAYCPDINGCLPILSGFDRICFGRLRQKRPDPQADSEVGTIYNSHCFCLDGNPIQVNDEDSWIFIKGFRAIRQDVEANQLYRPPGYRDTWDFTRTE
jgi:hypothetical protein